jgi:threonine/homoserine/homoserine lactone efflux protein
VNSLLVLIGATAVLVAIPGPNAALIVGHSVRYGIRVGLVTVVGTTLGTGLQLLLVVLGLATLLEIVSSALIWLKWLGAAYLVYLGIRTWNRNSATGISVAATGRGLLDGAVLALANPKTLAFNAAFLPQFIATDANPGQELAIVAAVFLAVLIAGDLLWVVFAAGARRWLARAGRLRDRLAGGFLVGAGVGLALAQPDR